MNGNEAVRELPTLGVAAAFDDRLGRSSRPPLDRSALATIGKAPVAPLRWLRARLRQRRNRLAVMDLSDEHLRDIGLIRNRDFPQAIRSFRTDL